MISSAGNRLITKQRGLTSTNVGAATALDHTRRVERRPRTNEAITSTSNAFVFNTPVPNNGEAERPAGPRSFGGCSVTGPGRLDRGRAVAVPPPFPSLVAASLRPPEVADRKAL